LADLARANISDYANNFRRGAGACDKQGLTDWIFFPENLSRSCLADQHDVRLTGEIVPIEVAPGDNRNAPGLEVSWHRIMGGRSGTLRHRRHIALRASIESGAVATGEREIAAHGHAFETRDPAQRLLRPLREALARRLIGIARLRKCQERHPEMIGPKAKRLLT
jgi:hypothetical protein